MAPKEEDLGSQIRNSIQKNMERAEAVQRKEFFRRRIDKAKEGIRCYDKKQYAPAVLAFKTYIKILEEWKGVAEGGLSPTYFDRIKDAHELLLISGVYWDLAKLYDRTKSHMRHDEFLHYLDKYVVFSKGMSYEPACAETLRKYVSNGKPIHTDAFKTAYRRLVGGSSKCFIATALAYECDPATLPKLREWRDVRLVRTFLGRGFIKSYYAVGPVTALLVLRLPESVRRALASILDRFASHLNW